MKTKLLKLLMLVVGLATGSAFGAGNVYDILPCTQTGATLSGPVSSSAAPLATGETVYFKLRLLRTLAMRTAGSQWTFKYQGGGTTIDEIVAELVTPLQIGIYVSGELRFATYVTSVDPNNSLEYRDFVFSYTTKPGDFALPIRLALSNGKPAGGEQSGDYVFMNRGIWNIVDSATSTPAEFTYSTSSQNFDNPAQSSPPEAGGRLSDYSLVKAGFYVKSLSFDPAWESEKEGEKFWRMVHSGSTITDSLTPRIVADAAPSNAVTLYVWSEDDSIVSVKGGDVEENFVVGYAGGVAQTRSTAVGKITFTAGKPSVDFQIQGGGEDAVGKSTNLILSAFPYYTFDQSNVKQPHYISVPVKCTEALPPTLIVETDKTTVYANGDRYKAAAQLSVYLSQAYDKPLEVTVTPTFENEAATGDIGDYVRFSRTASELSSLPVYAAPTVTIPANSTGRQTLFLYVLRSDAFTTGDGNQIKFTPSFTDTDAAAVIKECQAAGVWISAENPVITTPGADAEYLATCGDEVELTVSVSDTVADLSDTETGYEVWFQAGAAAKLAKLDGTYINSDGELKLLKADGTAGDKGPIVTWNQAGEQISRIYVVSPVSGKKSEIVTFKATVAPARTAKVESTDAESTYYEGGTVNFKVVLSEENNTGNELYAFLMPSANADPGMFRINDGTKFILDPAVKYDDMAEDERKAATKGIQIRSYNGDADTPVIGKFQVLDGDTVANGGLGLYFSVVLCTTEYYSEANRYPGYDSNTMNITVYNVEPTIDNVVFADFELNDYADHEYPFAIPKGQTQTIELDVSDPGAYDIAQGIDYKWTAQSDTGGRGNGTGKFTETDNSFTFNFPRAGIWTVKIQVKDKDMGNKYSPQAYSFTVKVLDQPQVTVTVPDLYSEDVAKQTIRVGLDVYNANDFIAVKLTVTPPPGANPGTFLLDTKYKAGKGTHYQSSDLGPNEYYVFFTDAGYEDILITSLDGTMLSDSKGFTVTAQVVGDGTGPDGAYTGVIDENTGADILWKDYYLVGTATATVANASPICEVTPENTNAWKVAGGLATAYPIRFTIRKDVEQDFAGITGFPGIKVTLLGCEGGQVKPAQANPMEFYVTESGTYVFTPDFGSVQGDQNVILTIEDKDGGYQSWTYTYTVTPSKFLSTTASGPSGGITTSALSQRYAQATGLGEGHVFVQGATLSSGADFTFAWNCSKNTEATVFAWGYKVHEGAGATDNGAIVYGAKKDPYGFGVSPEGGLATAAPYYQYPETERDSYLYTWLYHTVGEQGGMASSLLGSIAPEKAEGKLAGGIVPLPNEQTEDGSYLKTYAEAVFAKEWRVLDNAGDINQDGIPDRAILKYGLGVIDTATGSVTGDDLVDVSAYNDDGDFLPAPSTGGNHLVPNVSGNWATQGGIFHAYYEVRGFGEGLNAGYTNPDGSAPAPDYTANEQRAYLAWKGIETAAALADMSDADVAALFNDPTNLAAATADLALANSGDIKKMNNGEPANGWSPERPTNPMEPDTDKDGLDDGYEYWFWYAAKVGFSDKGKWQSPETVGRRLNLADLENFDPIPAADICQAFDPLVNGGGEGNAATQGNLNTRDFDHDGLYDLEEYLIGTNPCDCDTDRGGVPDGYEVMWGLNPLDDKDDAGTLSNPDGDHMAYANLGGAHLYQFVSAEREGAPTRYVYLVDDGADFVAGTFVGSLLASKPEDGTPYTVDDVTTSLNGEAIPRAIGASGRVAEPGDISEVQDDYANLALVHDQVFAFYGFDPRTGWSSGCKDGYVTGRWCPAENGTDPNILYAGLAGLAVNTKPYTTLDEYLCGKYRNLGASPASDNVLKWLKENCTNPNVAFADKAHGDSGMIYSSEQHGADTNGDGVPDGWTLYCGGDPISVPSPWGAQNPDGGPGGDELTNAAEFLGTDTVSVYAACPTIASNAVATAGWLNKFFPTNPYDGDTDGDRVSDSDEGAIWEAPFYVGRQVWPIATYSFIYGTATDDGTTLCFRGGGMNPCSSDTDFDGLPDRWEKEFAGIVVTPAGAPAVADNDPEMYTDALKIADGFGLSGFAPQGDFITGGMDATDGGDAATTTLPDEYVGKEIVRDRDFDRDGLENFQEYLVQSVRAWRYDDAETPLMGHWITWGDGDSVTDARRTNAPMMNILSGREYLAAVKGAFGADYAANPYVATLSEYDYANMGYMAPADHEWDPFRQREEILRVLTGDFEFHYGYMRPPQAMTAPGVRIFSLAYASTDPRQWDTDADGMDDYWEIFHGLNPVLGSLDVISTGYMGAISADENAWVNPANDPGMDPIRAPWRMGLPDADPDGDGLRNIDEAIAGNMTNPSTYHTDPSPLWMTDKSSPLSYVRNYYHLPQVENDMTPDLPNYPWLWSLDTGIGSAEGASLLTHVFSFEETEGYDTDGDWKGDAHEVVKNVQPSSDPLDATDPDRRTALWLGGDADPSCAYSVMEGNVPVVDAYDVFRQFTVECWVKPEESGRAQTILERGFVYGASNLENAAPVWRANFRVGLNAAGNVYGLFDNDNAVASGSVPFSSQMVSADVLPLNEWSHVALRFDGKELSLYVNGQPRTNAKTDLIPANGVLSVLQEPADTNLYPMATYLTVPGANTIGARRTAIEFDWNGGFGQFDEFFKGHVAEVRFWDGVCTDREILGAFNRRLSAADAAANREAVFKAWNDGATRNGNDGKETLPAQLMSLYNFQQLPAALASADAAKVPSGFASVLANINAGVGADESEVGWWKGVNAALRSSVYDDLHVVPWIQNTVSHLPFLNGSFADSMFWSSAYAGYTPASANGSETYAIPNGGNPYKGRSYMAEADLHHWRLQRLSEAYETTQPALAEMVADSVARYEFEMRSQFVGLDDLVPLGGAFAKLDKEFWDGLGATTAWSDTGTDADGDGLPKWWEELYGTEATVQPDTVVDYGGVQMPAWEAYLRDLAAGMQPDGSVDGDYAAKSDADGDGLVDWWQGLYAVEGGATGDDDGDGLANYVEYLLSEIFKVGRFSPTDAFSVNEHASDYFHRVGESYVGEIFTDHDRMDDTWEDGFEKVTRYLYDAHLDPDEDGWSNYAEFQAGTDPMKFVSLGIDEEQMPEYPVPVIETTLRYEGGKDVDGKPFVVKAWRDATLQSMPDAVWNIGGGDTSVSENGATATVTGQKYVGMNPGKSVMMHLSPGSVVAGSVRIEFMDTNWILVDTTTGQSFVSGAARAQWMDLVTDRQRPDDRDKGDIVYVPNTDLVLGEIDYTTGAVTIDFSNLPQIAAIDGDVSATDNNAEAGATKWVSIYQLDTSYVRLNWNSQPIVGGSLATYYLADADGHVKEGRNTFVAFCDLDGDGQYTAGEPYGVATDVDVGWNHAKVGIELTDTSPISARFRVGGGQGTGAGAAGGAATAGATEVPNDRATVWGPAYSSNADISQLPTTEPSGAQAHVRVVRTHLGGYQLGVAPYQKVLPRVVLDKVVNLTDEPYITEADFLRGGALDIDWEFLAQDLAAVGHNIGVDELTNVTYHVILGDADYDLAMTNNSYLAIAFNRKFDDPKTFKAVTPRKIGGAGDGIVITPSPTFSWTIPYGFNSYTAFRIEVRDAKTKAAVWDSGFRRMPARVRDTQAGDDSAWRYDWTAPLFADALTDTGGPFANGKDYEWRVKPANALYRDTDNWSDWSAFSMNVLTNASDRGVMNVAVRYFGPSVVADSGPVRVQAFTTPDFNGVPAGEGHVTDVTTLADASGAAVANATIIGLGAGTYYVRAFIDTQLDGACAGWESWGFACERDARGVSIYTPKAVTVGPKGGAGEMITVYVDDCDTDKDNLPDAWEWSQKGSLTALDVTAADKPLTGSLAVRDELTAGLADAVGGTLGSGLAVKFKSLGNPYVAAMVLGVDVSGTADADAAASAVAGAVAESETLEPKEVSVTGISIGADGDISIDIAATAESEGLTSGGAGALYTFPAGSVTVKMKLLAASDLANPDWTVVAEENLVLTAGEKAQSVKPGATATGGSGFYKVTLEEIK